MVGQVLHPEVREEKSRHSEIRRPAQLHCGERNIGKLRKRPSKAPLQRAYPRALAIHQGPIDVEEDKTGHLGCHKRSAVYSSVERWTG